MSLELKTEKTVLQQQELKDLTSNHGRDKYAIVTRYEELHSLALRLSQQSLIAWDTETNGTFDRFKVELVGVSVAFEDEAYYIPVGHYDGEQLPINDVLDALQPILENPNIEKVCHNAKFDEMIMGIYNIDCKGQAHDTFIAAWELNEERGMRGLKPLVEKYLDHRMMTYEEVVESAPKKKGVARDYNFARVPLDVAVYYASEDAYWTLQLHHRLSKLLEERKVWDSYFHVECPFNRTLRRVEGRGVLINEEAIEEANKRLPEILEQVEASIYQQAGEVFEIGSPLQLGKILFEKLGIGNNVAKTATGQYRTDKKTLERYAASHKIVADILRRKKIQKTHSTFIEGLRKNITKDGRVHPHFNSTGTVTGRLSCNNPNLQNVISDEVEEVKSRDFFIPAPGYKFIVVDYSQVELRIMAHLSKATSMINQFLAGADFHQLTADKMSEIMNKAILRKHAKPLNFGIGYGREAFSVAETLNCSTEEAQAFIDAWWMAYPEIAAYKKYLITKARKDGYVRTMTGRYRVLPEIISDRVWIRKKGERKAFNTRIQGSAADIIKMAMISLEPALQKIDAHMVIQIHDELVIEVPEDIAYDTIPTVKSIMEHPFKGTNPLRLPLIAEPKVVDKWGDAKD